MNLNLKEKIWSSLFKSKLLRYFIFYKLSRYKTKLASLDKLNLNKNSIIVDVGANNGIISQYLFDKYSCKIHSFEPNPYCFEILKKIFKGNNKVKLYNMAISNTSKVKKLYFSNRSFDITDMGLSEIPSLEKKKLNISKKHYVYVKCTSINKLISRLKFVNFIKIDIEGHEYKILPSILKNIKNIEKIFCEMHGKNHRPEFRKEFKKWDKKLLKFRKNKFFYW